MSKQAYIVRIRREKLPTAPPDWLQKLSAIPGVEVVGSYQQQAQILANTEAIERVRSELQDVALIEETKERTPTGPEDGLTKP